MGFTLCGLHHACEVCSLTLLSGKTKERQREGEKPYFHRSVCVRVHSATLARYASIRLHIVRYCRPICNILFFIFLLAVQIYVFVVVVVVSKGSLLHC